MTRRSHDRSDGSMAEFGGKRTAAIVLVALASACSSATPASTPRYGNTDRLVDAKTVAEIRARTESVFDRATLVKPRASADEDMDITQAPLFVVDVSAVDARLEGSEPFFCTQTFPRRGVHANLSNSVYVDRADIEIAGHSYVQVVYAWKCVLFLDPMVLPAERRLCGVRATLSPDGRPLVWETLIHPWHDVVYVSRSLEDAAVARFGAPLPGHAFAAERSQHEAPATVVARVLDDGPLPLGPYVYLNRGADGITTLLCRCSPSQMNDVIDTVEYQLHDADELGPGWQARLLSATAKPLDQRLRWPYP